ncbi:MAG TPA: DNA-3-methyladenine glycosylase I [Spirochaetia bacterium]|jgi:DNA-3-methyladenine glycosylase I|nr:DNA-3-methyladenine glycosylase I [Spirochaetia bacterium]
MTYCEYCRDNPDDPWNVPYHDTLYGFPLDSDDELFGRLILEINQAGLSWLTILKKADAFRQAYSNYAIDAVAAYTDADRERLLANPGIIRNRLKVDAAIDNARRLVEIRRTHGSFAAWLGTHHPLTKDEWTKLFKKTFRFTGGEIVNEFLMSSGWLPGAHHEGCPVLDRVRALDPPWARMP